MSQSGSDLPELTPDGVDRESAEAALARVLNSRAFVSSAQSRTFLAHVAGETLAGRGEQLTERSVGRNALGRPALFDGRSDSLVRVQASRVRKALLAYYAEEGASDPVRVVLPAGRYAVSFEYVDLVDEEDDPVVLVTVPRALDADAANGAAASAGAIVHALAGLPGVTVVGPLQVDGDAVVEARSRRTEYVLSGTAASVEGGVRVLLQLMETRRAATLWTKDQVVSNCADSLDAWSLSVAADLGDYTGVVLRNEVDQGVDPSVSRTAKRSFYSFAKTGDLDDLRRSADLLAKAMAEGEVDPLLRSMRAGVCSLVATYHLTDDVEETLRTAETLGREVLTLDPTSGLAHVALGIVALVRGDQTMVRHHAELAVRCWPHHPSTLLSTAGLLSSVGDWTSAADKARYALELTSLLPGAAWTVIAIERLLADDDEAALTAASHIHAQDFPWGPLYRALAYDGLGRHDRAREEMAVALAVEPTLVDDPRAFFEELWTWQPEELASLLARFDRYRALEAAGAIPVPRHDTEQQIGHGA